MIAIRDPEEVELLRESGRVVADALDLAERMIRPGLTTGELDREIETLIRDQGGTPEFKGFHGYPASICASVNEVVVHGIPGPRELREGDIIGVDVGVRKSGYVGDGARTFPVGEIREEARRLMDVTYQALMNGLAAASDGRHLSDLSSAIQTTAESHGYSVVRELAGHGVGREMHEAPEVPNYGQPGYGPVLKAGMVLAVEPMVNAGSAAVRTLPDGWTVVTADASLSAHFEHSVAVTGNGIDILTLSSETTSGGND
jgi:methionyl aminopeptidase